MDDGVAPQAFAADDDAARVRALDTGRSFLVQAPAGSGKTGLLIQRYLALLARVERPERIVAITFTRKAAGEMRERITGALRDAAAQTPVDTPHDARTRELALAALAQDARQGWQLVAHPSRLAVLTIDALSLGLARQAPLATGLGAAPRLDEHAAPLYAEAARAALATASADDPAWRRLLAHLDNDADRVVALLADMLGKRDQWWHPVVAAARRGDFRAMLEAALADEISGEIGQAAALFPVAHARALAESAAYAATHLPPGSDSADLAAHLEACAAGGGLPPRSASALPHWRAMADWMLVAKQARFRESLSKNDGFPAIKKGRQGAAERRHRNEAMKTLLRELSTVPHLADALDSVRRLPPPSYTDETWAIVDALLDILPRVAAQLTLTFRDAGAIDFVQANLGALLALGEDDAPTELLLRLDFQIQHLLIDEFQDTSFTQIELIRRLTAGWQQDDGRTLFAVGDPMQSIYRFRGAEVRLFVEAQQCLLVAELPVENLVLRSNFRSQAGLVAWVNEVFAQVLGTRSDPWRSAVGFSPAMATRDPWVGLATTLDIVADADTEARSIVRHLQAALADGAESIAVLVRARSHLEALLPALRAEGIAFAAVELDALAERQAILDLVSLTHALTQPADRLAWLAVLRAPWCGMLLADLLAIVKATDAHRSRSVAGLLEPSAPVAGLSADGQARFARLATALQPALHARGRADVAAVVRGAWLALGGAATLTEAVDLEAAERYFALLAGHNVAGDVPDWPAFVGALDKLHAAPDAKAAARVQVMTLHRAKGLEFDVVIMPGLARRPNRANAEMLRWRRRPKGLLLAPMKAKGGSDDPVHAYLRLLAGSEESAELGRLLYVGSTRAKRRLHLTAVLKPHAHNGDAPAWARPTAGSALAKFWDVVAAQVAPPLAVAPTRPLSPPSRPLDRWAATWSVPAAGPGLAIPPALPEPAESIPFDWAREAARHAGTVAHRLLAQIARDGVAAWDAARIAASSGRIRAELERAGVDDADLDGAAAIVAGALGRLLDDERGRWLFDPAHSDPRSEWALSGVEGDAFVHVVLDRSFVTDGVRWVVDFKTGAHEGGDVDAFLEREVERHRGQLERYARFVRALDARPIRLGLYFPLQGRWHEWPYDG